MKKARVANPLKGRSRKVRIDHLLTKGRARKRPKKANTSNTKRKKLMTVILTDKLEVNGKKKKKERLGRGRRWETGANCLRIREEEESSLAEAKKLPNAL